MGRSVVWLLGLVALLSVGSAAAAAPHPLKGVALVIGETDYVRLPVLANPDKDARDVDHMLDDLGFDVTRALDVGTDQLRKKIDDFLAGAKGADVALVYYAGHGIEAGGKDYIMGTDADISSAASATETLVSLDDTLARLKATVPVTIMLLDACRTNPFTGQQTLDLTDDSAPVPIGQQGLEIMRGPTPVNGGKPGDGLGMVIGFSASPGQSALDGPAGENSPYASALLQHLSAGGYSFGDIMTMVTQEVYVDTGARQLPWTSSSLSEILYFGRDADQPQGDDAAILGDRRKLLLQIAAVPDETKGYVETVATQENLKLADLYSMLDVINSSKSPDINHQSLLDVAQRVREVLDDPILAGTPTDPQLARLDGLASKAIAAGAFQRALDYRQQEAKRAAEIEKGLDAQQADIDAQRQELAGVYARVAEAAMYTLNSKVESDAYQRAAKQSDLFDKSISIRLRLRAANLLASQAQATMDEHTGMQAIALYQDILKEIDKAAQPILWADTQLRLGWTIWDTANRQDDKGLNAEAVDVAHLAATGFSPATDHRRWNSAQLLLAEALRHNDRPTEAMQVITALLAVTDKAQYPIDWANGQQSLAEMQSWAGWGQSDVDTTLIAKAASAYQEAADVTTRYLRWMHILMLQKASEIRVYLAIRQNDKAALGKALQDGRDALAMVDQPKGEQWGNQATYLGRNLIAAGLYLADPKLLKEGLALTAKAEKIITHDNNLDDWFHMREADGNALTWLGTQTPRDPKALQAAVKAYDDASEGIRDADHWDFDRPRLKKIEVQQLLGQKLSPADALLVNLPPPGDVTLANASLAVSMGGENDTFEGYQVDIKNAQVGQIKLDFPTLSIGVSYNSPDKIPSNTMLLSLNFPTSALFSPASRDGSYDHCSPLNNNTGQVTLMFGKESFLNACQFAKMAPADAAVWEALVARLPELFHQAAASDPVAAHVDQLFAAKPAQPAAVFE